MQSSPILRSFALFRRFCVHIAGYFVKFLDLLAERSSTIYDERMPANAKRWFGKLIGDWHQGELPSLFPKRATESQFYPAALEIAERPPSPASRVIAYIIMAFLAFALLWASIGSVDIIATAQGKIVPTGRTKVIQPLEAGVVRAIHVQDGQSVRAGEVLVEIDSTITESERDRLQKEYIRAALDATRLKAALDLAADSKISFVPPEGATEGDVETQRTLLINQTREIRAKLQGLDQQIMQQEGNVTAVRSTIKKLNDSIPYLSRRAITRKSLSDQGYGSKLDYLQTQQDLVEHQQEVEVQKGRLTEAEGALASLRQDRDEAEAEYQHENLTDLEEAQQKATSLHEQLLQAAQKYRLQTLIAPVDGTVQQLAIHTEGGVVTPAETLMSIVPIDSRFEIEAMVSNQDIGFVRAGQDAAIKVDTFSFTRYGLLHGKVLSVSQDAIVRDKPQDPNADKRQTGAENDSSEPKGQELNYMARVSLDQTQMDIDDRMVSLSPGMAVTVEIKTGSRHVISYLLSPIKKHLSQAIRER